MLTRKMLKAMGIEDEKIDQIIDAHSESVDALKKERDQYKDDAEKYHDAQKELDKTKKDLQELKDAQEQSDGKNPWKVKYDAVKEDFDKYKADVDAEKSKQAKEKALREFLKGIGVSEKRLDAVVRVSDMEGLEVEDGKIKDEGGKLAAKLKEEWSDFIVTSKNEPQGTETPPKGEGGKPTRQQILEIKDSAERQKAIADNIDLFR